MSDTGPTIYQIVHVDDDIDILSIAKMALEALGPFQVASFSSGSAALERISSISPDLILLDLAMPEMDGRETMRQIKEIPALTDTPTVFLTAQLSPEVKRELMDLGALEVLPKPFDPMSLHVELAKYIEA